MLETITNNKAARTEIIKNCKTAVLGQIKIQQKNLVYFTKKSNKLLKEIDSNKFSGEVLQSKKREFNSCCNEINNIKKELIAYYILSAKNCTKVPKKMKKMGFKTREDYISWLDSNWRENYDKHTSADVYAKKNLLKITGIDKIALCLIESGNDGISNAMNTKIEKGGKTL